MNVGVPEIWPVTVSASSGESLSTLERAMPKSVITARSPGAPSRAGISMTLPVLKSRCTMPARWAASRAAQICSARGNAAAGSSRPTRFRRSASVSPGISSMVRKKTPGSSPLASAGQWWMPRSKMRQTLGWVTLRARWISRLKRLMAFSSPAISGRMVLRATRSCSSVSSTSYTSPIPPRPMKRTTW